jgi:Asp/Glu/hydantoin racemase
MLINRLGTSTAGHSLGILHIESRYPLVPGNVQNASTFDFPVIYGCAKGVSPQSIMAGQADALESIIDAAVQLEQRGARAIVGACGSFANFQPELRSAVRIPIFASVLTLVPFALGALNPNQRLGLVFASKTSFTDRVKAALGIGDEDRLSITDCTSLPSFQAILHNQDRLDSDSLERELVDHISEFISADPSIGAILLQCSELPPYARAIQRAVALPVFDVTSLGRWVHQTVSQQAYSAALLEG